MYATGFPGIMAMMAATIAVFGAHSAMASPRPTPTGVAIRASRASKDGMHIMDDTPNLPFDPNTEPSCTWWWDNDGSIPCASMPAEWGISLADF